MAEIINLRKARKAKARAERDGQAAENRAKFGQPKHARDRNKALEDIEKRRLDSHRRDESDEPGDHQ